MTPDKIAAAHTILETAVWKCVTCSFRTDYAAAGPLLQAVLRQAVSDLRKDMSGLATKYGEKMTVGMLQSMALAIVGNHLIENPEHEVRVKLR